MWFEQCENPQAMARLYDSGEGLDQVEVHEVTLRRDGGTLDLRVQLTRFPDHPPAKWDAASNAVQVNLKFSGLENLKITEWAYENIGRLSLVKVAERQLDLRFDSTGMQLSVRCGGARIESFQPYIEERHEAEPSAPKIELPTARPGDTVRIHYIGMHSDGSIFDSSHEEGPLEFTIGAEQVVPGLEQGVIGMRVDSMRTVEVPAAQAYGALDPALAQWVGRDRMPDDVEVGMMLQIDGTTDAQGDPMRVVVRELKDDKALVDLNHPMAGRDLTFRVELLEIL